MDYSQEPEVVFSPLSEKQYCRFYHLEMASFSDDVSFYLSILNPSDTVLELGCGCGRLTHLLTDYCHAVTGIDISAQMILRAQERKAANISFRIMDMLQFHFPHKFNAIIIPYNTLNLLGDHAKTEKCLRLCHRHLLPDGKLLLHLYHPNSSLIMEEGKRVFQFQVFPEEKGDIVVKETLKSYSSTKRTLTLEERYRVRPHLEPMKKQDLHHFLHLFVPDRQYWHDLLLHSGFDVIGYWGSYDKKPFSQKDDTLLLVHAAPGKERR